jgi:O-antigen/teichoic acid export membrane protein
VPFQRLLDRLRTLSRPKRNLVANLIGNSWSAILQLAIIPIYIRLLGDEGYGLFAFYYTLLGAIQILDFGFSVTINREMARYSVQPDKVLESRNMIRTLEILYSLIGLLIGISIVALAPTIALQWIGENSLPDSVLIRAIALMGVLAFLQWPLTFYQGALVGMQRQVRLMALQISMATLRSIGAIIVLQFVSRTIEALLIWQCTVSLLNTLLIWRFTWASLPQTAQKSTFDSSLLRQIRRFALGVGTSALVVTLLTQASGFLLIRLVGLKGFGYYTIASTVGTSIGMLIIPIYNTIAPRFASLVAQNDERALRDLYHFGTQIMVVIVLPIGCAIAVFAYELISLWQGNATVAAQITPISQLLIVASMLNGLMNLPYALQLAYGWSDFSAKIGLLMFAVLILIYYFAVPTYGATGAAFAWLVANILYFVVGVPATHSRVLKGEVRRWYLDDVLLPLITILIAITIIHFVYTPVNTITLALTMITTVVLTGLAACLAAWRVRKWAFAKVRGMFASA